MEDTLEVDQGLSLVQLHAATQTTSVDSTESNLMEVDVYGFGQDQICLEDVIPNTRNIRDALEAVWDIDIEEIAALHEVLEPHHQETEFWLGVLPDGNESGQQIDIEERRCVWFG